MKRYIRSDAVPPTYLYHGTQTYSQLCSILQEGLKLDTNQEVCCATDLDTAQGYGSFIVRIEASSLNILIIDHNPTKSDYSKYSNYDGIQYLDTPYILNIDKLNDCPMIAVATYPGDRMIKDGPTYDPFQNANVLFFDLYDSSDDIMISADTLITQEIASQIPIVDAVGRTIPSVLKYNSESDRLAVLPVDLLQYRGLKFAVVADAQIVKQSIEDLHYYM